MKGASIANTIALIFLSLAIVTAPLLRGGNLPVAHAIVGILAFCGLLASLAGRQPDQPAGFIPLVVRLLPHLLWLSLLAWIALQLLPLPPSLLQQLSPTAYDIHNAVDPGGTAQRFRISVSPGAGYNGVLLTLSLYATYWLTWRCSGTTAGIRAILMSMTLIGALEAAYGTAQALYGFEIPLLDPGRLRPESAAGTFLNRNHFAAYLSLCAAACITLLLTEKTYSNTLGLRSNSRRVLDMVLSGYPIFRIALLVMALGIVLSRSRMGNTAFALGLAAAGIMWLLAATRVSTMLKGLLLFASVAIIDIAIVSGHFGLDAVLDRIEATEIEREARPVIYRSALPLATTYARTGSGLGSFQDVYQSQRASSSGRFVDHAHNDYLEFIIELGVPGLAILAMLVGYHGLAALVGRSRRRTLPRGVATGGIMVLTAALIHAAVEFNFQIYSYAMTFVVWLALISSCLRSRVNPRQHGSSAR